MWYTLLTALKTYLDNDMSLLNVDTRLGDSSQVYETTTLVLLRGTSKPDERLRNIRGLETLHIESWVISDQIDDEQITLDGYSQLEQLERDLTIALQSFGRGQNTVDGYHITVKLNPFEGDGDQFRPSVASRITIEINYTKINP